MLPASTIDEILHKRKKIHKCFMYIIMNSTVIYVWVSEWVSEWKSLSHVRLFVTPWTVAHQTLLCPWDSPGKNTGVGCHSLLQGMYVWVHTYHTYILGEDTEKWTQQYCKTEVGDPVFRTLHFHCSRVHSDLWLDVRQYGQKKKKWVNS